MASGRWQVAGLPFVARRAKRGGKVADHHVRTRGRESFLSEKEILMNCKHLFPVPVVVALAFGVAPAGAAPAKPKVDEKSAKAIAAAVPKEARVKPAKKRKMLVLSYQSHDGGRFAGDHALQVMADRTGAFELTFVHDKNKLAEVVMPDYLAQFDAVCVNNSTGGAGKAKNGKELVENLEGLFLERNAPAVAEKLAGPRVHLERAEACSPRL